MSMAISSRRMGTCNEEFPSIKSADPLITWYCKVA